MNFLAHLWLADQSGTSLAGSVLGDVVHGVDLSAYPAEIAEGVRLHRRIDAATDRHPRIVALREGYPDGARRYAGIILDLVADYVLIQQWPLHSAEPLDVFCRRCGLAIEAAAPWFLLAGGRSSSAAHFERLLHSYGEVAGLERAIQRTSARLRRPERLLKAAAGWQVSADALRPHLGELLHDLRAIATEPALAEMHEVPPTGARP